MQLSEETIGKLNTLIKELNTAIGELREIDSGVSVCRQVLESTSSQLTLAVGDRLRTDLAVVTRDGRLVQLNKDKSGCIRIKATEVGKEPRIADDEWNSLPEATQNIKLLAEDWAVASKTHHDALDQRKQFERLRTDARIEINRIADSIGQVGLYRISPTHAINIFHDTTRSIFEYSWDLIPVI